jgi:hypothetical protein
MPSSPFQFFSIIADDIRFSRCIVGVNDPSEVTSFTLTAVTPAIKLPTVSTAKTPVVNLRLGKDE